MKKFYLLELFPYGWNQSGNRVLEEYVCCLFEDAVKHFQQSRPILNLNNNGYSKDGRLTYCIAEAFSH